jgi:antitoxin (DNA-binding transcriptional repressor) of toxin-antitoxin stability system
MTTIGAYQAKTHLPELLERVARGEDIMITRHGKPIAFLTAPPVRAKDVRKTVAHMLAYRERRQRTTGGLSPRKLIEEGRRF